MSKRTKLKNFIKSLTTRHTMSLEEKYLSESVDLVDLEVRQRKIQNGNAPFQKQTRIW